MNTRAPIERTDDLDTLSAIWILSCNDDNPIMTYRGIAQRLALPDDEFVRTLVRSRSELFRPGILNSRLRDWKANMKSGKHRPAWVIEIQDKKEQEATIDRLTRDDVFRNQFRVERDAPKCSIEIIDWGLKHIERLRKDRSEEKDANQRKWSSIVIPLGSLAVALVSVLSSMGIQWVSIREQGELKRYEVSFKPKQEAYSNFMGALVNATNAAALQDKATLLVQFGRMEMAYFLIEPFLGAQLRQELFLKYSELVALCEKQTALLPPEAGQRKEAFIKEASVYRQYFQSKLYSSLFQSFGSHSS